MPIDYRLLDPDLADRARQLESLAHDVGIPLLITSGYRSPEAQAALYAQGRTAPGSIVTNAQAGHSYHNRGQAIDVVPLKNGQPDWESPHWDRLGELGKGLGLRWGGDFKSIKDRPHFELGDMQTPRGTSSEAATPVRDLVKELYGDKPTMTTPAQWRTQLKLDDLEAREGLPQGTLTEVLTQESGGRNNRTSRAGAQGLFQLMPATAAAYQADAWDPAQAADVAATELGKHYRRYGGDLQQALAAWNWGSDNLQEQGLARAPQETRTFLQRVLAALGPRAAEAAGPRRDLGRELYGPPPAAPATPSASAPRDLVQELYGPYPTVAPSTSPTDTASPEEAAQRVQTFRQNPQAAFLPPGVPTIAQETLEPTQSPFEMLLGGYGTGMAGRALGRAVAPVAGAVAGAGRRLLGAGAQTLGMESIYKAQQAVGLEPGSPTEIGLGDVLNTVPVAAELGGAVKRWVVRHLPGAPAALHEDIAQRLTQAVQDLAPPAPSGPMYAAALEQNPTIAGNRLGTESLRIARHERGLSPSNQNPQSLNMAEDMLDVVTQHRNQIPLQRMYDEMQRLGLKVKEARRAGGTELGDYKALYAAFHRDMEIAASRGVPGAAQLKEAIATARREFAVDDLAELFTPGAGRGLSTRADGLTTISGGGLRDRFEKTLRNDDTLRNTFRPGELDEIRNLITEAERLRPIPASPGQVTGSSKVLAQAVAGNVVGGPIGSALAVYAPQIIAAGLMHPRGRALIRNALREHGGIDPMTLAALSSLVRTEIPAESPRWRVSFDEPTGGTPAAEPPR